MTTILKTISLIIITLALTSCRFPLFTQKYQNTGVNFTTGKWLLNEINAPIIVNEKLTKLAIKDFNLLTKNNLEYALTSKKVILRKIKYSHIAVNELKQIKKETDFDFLININAFIDNDFKTNNQKSFGNKKSVVISIEIYDLNNYINIYRQELRGSIKDSENLNDKTINFGSKFLILNGYKKIIRDITKKSIIK